VTVGLDAARDLDNLTLDEVFVTQKLHLLRRQHDPQTLGQIGYA
jgi:hypothetical protein